MTGKCQAAGFLETAKVHCFSHLGWSSIPDTFLSQAWYLANLQIAIPVTVVAGLVVLSLLWGIIRGSYIFNRL